MTSRAGATQPKPQKTCASRAGRLRSRVLAEDGSQLIEMALVLPLYLMILMGAVDFGRAYYVNLEVATAAEAGALYGVQNPTDVAGMQAAAQLSAPDLPAMTAVASWGSECSDGTSAVVEPGAAPTCSVNAFEYVEVDTSAVYSPILPYPGFQTIFTFTGKSRMRASF